MNAVCTFLITHLRRHYTTPYVFGLLLIMIPSSAHTGQTARQKEMVFLRNELLAHHDDINRLVNKHSGSPHNDFHVASLLEQTTTLPTSRSILPSALFRIHGGTKMQKNEAPTELLLTALGSTTTLDDDMSHLNLPALHDSTQELYRHVFNEFIDNQKHKQATPRLKQKAKSAFDELYYHSTLGPIMRPALAQLTAQLILLHKSPISAEEKRIAHEKMVGKTTAHLLRKLQAQAYNPHEIPFKTLINLQESILSLTKVFPTKEWGRKLLYAGSFTTVAIALLLAYYFRNSLKEGFAHLKRAWHDWKRLRHGRKSNVVINPHTLTSHIPNTAKEMVTNVLNPVTAMELTTGRLGGILNRRLERRNLELIDASASGAGSLLLPTDYMSRLEAEPAGFIPKVRKHFSQVHQLRDQAVAQRAAYLAALDTGSREELPTADQLQRLNAHIKILEDALREMAPQEEVTALVREIGLAEEDPRELNDLLNGLWHEYDRLSRRSEADVWNSEKRAQMIASKAKLEKLAALIELSFHKRNEINQSLASIQERGMIGRAMHTASHALSTEGLAAARAQVAQETIERALDREADAARVAGNGTISLAARGIKRLHEQRASLQEKQRVVQSMLTGTGIDVDRVLQERATDLAAAIGRIDDELATTDQEYRAALHTHRVDELASIGRRITQAQRLAAETLATQRAALMAQLQSKTPEHPAVKQNIADLSDHVARLREHEASLNRLAAQWRAKQAEVAEEDVATANLTIAGGLFSGPWHGFVEVPELPALRSTAPSGLMKAVTWATDAEAREQAGAEAREQKIREFTAKEAAEAVYTHDKQTGKDITLLEAIEKEIASLQEKRSASTTAAEQAQIDAKLANANARRLAASKRATRRLETLEAARAHREAQERENRIEAQLTRAKEAARLLPDDADTQELIVTLERELQKHQRATVLASVQQSRAAKAAAAADAAEEAARPSMRSRLKDKTFGAVGRWFGRRTGAWKEWWHSNEAQKELKVAKAALTAAQDASAEAIPAQKGSPARKRRGRKKAVTTRGRNTEQVAKWRLKAATAWHKALEKAVAVETKINDRGGSKSSREALARNMATAHEARAYHDDLVRYIDGERTDAPAMPEMLKPKKKPVRKSPAPAASPPTADAEGSHELPDGWTPGVAGRHGEMVVPPRDKHGNPVV